MSRNKREGKYAGYHFEIDWEKTKFIEGRHECSIVPVFIGHKHVRTKLSGWSLKEYHK